MRSKAAACCAANARRGSFSGTDAALSHRTVYYVSVELAGCVCLTYVALTPADNRRRNFSQSVRPLIIRRHTPTKFSRLLHPEQAAFLNNFTLLVLFLVCRWRVGNFLGKPDCLSAPWTREVRFVTWMDKDSDEVIITHDSGSGGQGKAALICKHVLAAPQVDDGTGLDEEVECFVLGTSGKGAWRVVPVHEGSLAAAAVAAACKQWYAYTTSRRRAERLSTPSRKPPQLCF